MTPRSAAERGPRTRAGQSLLRQWSGHVNEPEVRIVVLAIEAEATTTVPADAWQAGYEACWNRLNDAGRLLPSGPREAAGEQRLRAARFVAEYWRGEYMEGIEAGDSKWAIGTHPLAMVLAALDGETDPRQLGLPETADDAFRSILLEGAARAALPAEGTE